MDLHQLYFLRTAAKSPPSRTFIAWWGVPHVVNLAAFTLCAFCRPLDIILISREASSCATKASFPLHRPLTYSDCTCSALWCLLSEPSAVFVLAAGRAGCLPRLLGLLGVSCRPTIRLLRRVLTCATTTRLVWGAERLKVSCLYWNCIVRRLLLWHLQTVDSDDVALVWRRDCSRKLRIIISGIISRRNPSRVS